MDRCQELIDYNSRVAHAIHVGLTQAGFESTPECGVLLASELRVSNTEDRVQKAIEHKNYWIQVAFTWLAGLQKHNAKLNVLAEDSVSHPQESGLRDIVDEQLLVVRATQCSLQEKLAEVSQDREVPVFEEDPRIQRLALNVQEGELRKMELEQDLPKLHEKVRKAAWKLEEVSAEVTLSNERVASLEHQLHSLEDQNLANMELDEGLRCLRSACHETDIQLNLDRERTAKLLNKIQDMTDPDIKQEVQDLETQLAALEDPHAMNTMDAEQNRLVHAETAWKEASRVHQQVKADYVSHLASHARLKIPMESKIRELEDLIRKEGQWLKDDQAQVTDVSNQLKNVEALLKQQVICEELEVYRQSIAQKRDELALWDSQFVTAEVFADQSNALEEATRTRDRLRSQHHQQMEALNARLSAAQLGFAQTKVKSLSNLNK